MVSLDAKAMQRMRLLVKVWIFCIDALKRILSYSPRAAGEKSRRVERFGGESAPVQQRHQP
jgi:hypothetical protein